MNLLRTYHPDALDRRDARLIEQLLPILERFTSAYFRLTCTGTVPAASERTPTLFISNHNGGIMGPDLFCTLSVLWRQLTPQRPLYALAHDFAMRQLTPLGRLLQKFGALAASRENANQVLAAGGDLLVYPGGDLDAYRSFKRRNEIVLFPRTGFVKVAQAHAVPIVPIVAHGAHRSAYIFSEGEALARLLRLQKWARLQRFPLALALPWIFAPGPWLPYLPLPFQVRLRILPAIHVAKSEAPAEVALHIQNQMQQALRELGT